MSWYALQHPELWLDHGGHLVGYVSRDDNAVDLAYLRERHSWVKEDEKPGPAHAVAASCQCGWRSPWWRAHGAYWQPFVVHTSEAETQRGQELFEKHVADVAAGLDTTHCASPSPAELSAEESEPVPVLSDFLGWYLGPHLLLEPGEKSTMAEVRRRMAVILGVHRDKLNALMTRFREHLDARQRPTDCADVVQARSQATSSQSYERLGSYALEETYWYNPTPKNGVSGAELQALWGALLGRISNERKQRADAAKLLSLPEPVPGLVQARYASKISVKTAESVAALLHRIIAPKVEAFCDHDCGHVVHGMSNTEAKRFLDSLDAAIDKGERARARTAFDHTRFDDVGEEMAVHTEWRRVLGKLVGNTGPVEPAQAPALARAESGPSMTSALDLVASTLHETFLMQVEHKKGSHSPIGGFVNIGGNASYLCIRADEHSRTLIFDLEAKRCVPVPPDSAVLRSLAGSSGGEDYLLYAVSQATTSMTWDGTRMRPEGHRVLARARLFVRSELEEPQIVEVLVALGALAERLTAMK